MGDIRNYTYAWGAAQGSGNVTTTWAIRVISAEEHDRLKAAEKELAELKGTRLYAAKASGEPYVHYLEDELTAQADQIEVLKQQLDENHRGANSIIADHQGRVRELETALHEAREGAKKEKERREIAERKESEAANGMHRLTERVVGQSAQISQLKDDLLYAQRFVSSLECGLCKSRSHSMAVANDEIAHLKAELESKEREIERRLDRQVDTDEACKHWHREYLALAKHLANANAELQTTKCAKGEAELAHALNKCRENNGCPSLLTKHEQYLNNQLGEAEAELRAIKGTYYFKASEVIGAVQAKSKAQAERIRELEGHIAEAGVRVQTIPGGSMVVHKPACDYCEKRGAEVKILQLGWKSWAEAYSERTNDLSDVCAQLDFVLDQLDEAEWRIDNQRSSIQTLQTKGHGDDQAIADLKAWLTARDKEIEALNRRHGMAEEVFRFTGQEVAKEHEAQTQELEGKIAKLQLRLLERDRDVIVAGIASDTTSKSSQKYQTAILEALGRVRDTINDPCRFCGAGWLTLHADTCLVKPLESVLQDK